VRTEEEGLAMDEKSSRSTSRPRTRAEQQGPMRGGAEQHELALSLAKFADAQQRVDDLTIFFR
jgi:hypothetical protein